MLKTVINTLRRPFLEVRPVQLILASIIMLGQLIATQVEAARPVVALAPLSGSKKAGTKTFEKALIQAFSAQAIDVLTPENIRKIAKKARGKSSSNYVASRAGADFKISVSIRSRKRGYQLKAQLVELVRNKTLESAKWNYKPTRKDRNGSIQDNAEKASAAIVKKFIGKMDDSFATMVGDNEETASELP